MRRALEPVARQPTAPPPERSAGARFGTDWHKTVSNGAPPPEHTPLAVSSESTSAAEDKALTIDNFSVRPTAPSTGSRDREHSLLMERSHLHLHPPVSQFMDDEDVVKVYVALAGDLEGATAEGVEFLVEKAPFDPTCSLLLHVRGKKHLHRLYVSHLEHMVVPEQCKFKILASKGKLIVTLKKADKAPWDALRAKVCLPFRRGGGG